jgi:hypothetical protein
MDALPFGFDTNPSHALEHMGAAGATVDSDPVRAAEAQSIAAVEAEGQARTAYDAARRVPNYPRDYLAALERQAADATAKRTALAARLRQDADQRYWRLKGRATDVLTRALAPPEGRDASADALEQHTLREKLAAIDPVERELMLRHAARTGSEPRLVRAALEAPKPGVGHQNVATDVARDRGAGSAELDDRARRAVARRRGAHDLAVAGRRAATRAGVVAARRRPPAGRARPASRAARHEGPGRMTHAELRDAFVACRTARKITAAEPDVNPVVPPRA